LITADGGGSNGSRLRLWKSELQGLADEIALAIEVHHLPPGTSKWNRIEHRLFSFISMNWRAKPLVIPIRLNLDLVQVGVAGEAAQAFCGECIPGSAERIDDGISGVEQAVAPVLLAQVQPDPLHRVDLR
jgi:hypothetical protein